MTEIVVTGQRITVITDPPSSGYYYSSLGGNYDPGGGGGTSGWDQTAAQMLQEFRNRTEEPQDTPCVSAIPDGFTKNQINAHAKAVGTELSSYNDYEYSSVIYANNGKIGKTPLFTSNSPNSVAVDTDAIPAGSTILGVVHNHRDRDVEIDKTPSPGDIFVVQDLKYKASQPNSTFATSPNMLLYIYDANSGKTYVYDNNNMVTNNPSCHLG